MLKHNLLAASLLALAVAAVPALAQDTSKYPDWSGQWKRPPGAGIQWDQTKRPGASEPAAHAGISRDLRGKPRRPGQGRPG